MDQALATQLFKQFRDSALLQIRAVLQLHMIDFCVRPPGDLHHDHSCSIIA